MIERINPLAMPFDLDNREEWLRNAINALAIKFSAVPKDVRAHLTGFDRLNDGRIHASIGIPRHAGKGHAIGQCWRAESSSDDTNHVFISPELSSPIEIIATLAHEMIHVADNCKHGHKGPFVAAMKAIGLAGKPTATVAGPSFYAWAEVLGFCLGKFPHGALSLFNPKKQGTRLIKASCEKCGYTVRVTQKWIDVALPTCTECTELEGERVLMTIAE